MVPVREVSWLCGEYCAAILFQKEDMILFRKGIGFLLLFYGTVNESLYVFNGKVQILQ